MPSVERNPPTVTPETNPGPWPITARRGSDGALELGGVDLRHLAARYGTPLYVFDERTLRETARGFREALAAHYPDSRVVYAGKAYLTTELVRIVAEDVRGRLAVIVHGREHRLSLRYLVDHPEDVGRALVVAHAAPVA